MVIKLDEKVSSLDNMFVRLAFYVMKNEM